MRLVLKGGKYVMKRFLLVVVVVVMVGLVLLSSCIPGSTSQARQTTTVRVGDLISGVVATGNLSLSQMQDLTFNVAGTLKELKIDEGVAVKKGQVIATLDDQSYRDDITSKELALRQQEQAVQGATLDLRRAQEQLEEIAPKTSTVYTYYTDVPTVQQNVALAISSIQEALDNLADGKAQEAKWGLDNALEYLNLAYSASSTSQFIPIERQKAVSDTIVTLRQYTYQAEKSQSAYDRAITTRDSAKLALEQSKKQLEKTVLTAPFDGVIAAVNVKEGANIGVNTAICRLVDPTQVEMKGLVDEGDAGKLKVGMEAIISLDAVPGVEMKGKLTFVSPIATIQSGVVYYQVVMSTEPQRTIVVRDGMTASANMILEKRTGVLLVSRRAIAGTVRERYVDVVVDEATGMTERRTVTTGMSDDDNIEITSGLKDGEKVLIAQAPGTRTTTSTGVPGMMIR
ncbi:MAG: efflux RND transporter periplasmic adaptor subunit [Chloroflexota bacterium]